MLAEALELCIERGLCRAPRIFLRFFDGEGPVAASL